MRWSVRGGGTVSTRMIGVGIGDAASVGAMIERKNTMEC